jgi:hypothetical protein
MQEMTTRRDHITQQHKQTTNITTMVMEPLASPLALIWWIHTAQVAGDLAHVLSKAAIKGFK